MRALVLLSLYLCLVVSLRAQSESKATLLVRTDADCSWRLDGDKQGSLEAGEPVRVHVEIGEHLIEATMDGSSVRWEKIIDVKEPKMIVLSIPIQSVKQNVESKAQQQAKDDAVLRAAQKWIGTWVGEIDYGWWLDDHENYFHFRKKITFSVTPEGTCFSSDTDVTKYYTRGWDYSRNHEEADSTVEQRVKQWTRSALNEDETPPSDRCHIQPDGGTRFLFFCRSYFRRPSHFSQTRRRQSNRDDSVSTAVVL